MDLNIFPLEERIVLDAAGAAFLEAFDADDGERDLLAQAVANDAAEEAGGAQDGEDGQEADVRVLAISSHVSEAEKLAAAAMDDVLTVFYDAEDATPESILEDIREALDGRRADSIAFAAHKVGSGDVELLSDTVVNEYTLESNEALASFWEGVGSLLDDDGRVDLLSCNVGAYTRGRNMVASLEDLTGREVAYSDDITGSVSYGDWYLEGGDVDLLQTYFVADEAAGWEQQMARYWCVEDGQEDEAQQEGQALATQILYGDGDDTNNYLAGSSWSHSFENLYDLVHGTDENGDSLLQQGDTVLVAEGYYQVYDDASMTNSNEVERLFPNVEEASDISFVLPEGVKFYGSVPTWTGGVNDDSFVENMAERDLSTEPTSILSGYIGTVSGGSSTYARHVVTGGEGVILDGFVIQEGRSVGADPESPADRSGGGLTVTGVEANQDLRYWAEIPSLNGDEVRTGMYIRYCTFRNNYAAASGGAMAINNSDIFIDDCEFYNNGAGMEGGAVHYSGDAEDVQLRIQYSDFGVDGVGNWTGSHQTYVDTVEGQWTQGQAVYGAIDADDPYFQDAKEYQYDVLGIPASAGKTDIGVRPADTGTGGALFATGNGSLWLSDSTFTANHAMQGGALALESIEPYGFQEFGGDGIERNTFEYNWATKEGGALYAADIGRIRFTRNVFESNVAEGTENDVDGDGETDDFEDLNRDGNLTDGSGPDDPYLYANFGDGGAAFITADSSPSLVNNIFHRNRADQRGGGVYVSNGATPEIVNAVFGLNEAVNGGGAYHTDGGNPNYFFVTFNNNTARGFGGAMYSENASPNVDNSILYGNSAGVGGDEISGSADVNYSVVQGGSPGTQNMDVNPRFHGDVEDSIPEDGVVDDLDGPDNLWFTYDDGLRIRGANLSLDAYTALVDSGSNARLPTDWNDIDGDLDEAEDLPRDIVGALRDYDGNNDDLFVVDRGAYEKKEILFVDKEADGDDSGRDWANAVPELRDGLDFLETEFVGEFQPYDEIWVAGFDEDEDPYTYTPAEAGDPDDPDDRSREASFDLPDDVVLYGGFSADDSDFYARDAERYRTVLSGDLDGDDGENWQNRSDNSYHVIVADGIEGAAMDGFVVTGGNAGLKDGVPIEEGDEEIQRGGGMYIRNSTGIRLNDMAFVDNRALIGGAVYVEHDNYIEDVHGSRQGAMDGEYDPAGGESVDASMTDEPDDPDTYSNSLVAGSENVQIVNSYFGGNSAQWWGGGTAVPSGYIYVANTTYSGNEAGWGGAVSNYSERNGWMKFVNTVFSGNQAATGGALDIYETDFFFAAEFVHCTLVGNSADWVTDNRGTPEEDDDFQEYKGGAIYLHQDAQAWLVNSIVWDNWVVNDSIQDLELARTANNFGWTGKLADVGGEDGEEAMDYWDGPFFYTSYQYYRIHYSYNLNTVNHRAVVLTQSIIDGGLPEGTGVSETAKPGTVIGSRVTHVDSAEEQFWEVPDDDNEFTLESQIEDDPVLVSWIEHGRWTAGSTAEYDPSTGITTITLNRDLARENSYHQTDDDPRDIDDRYYEEDFLGTELNRMPWTPDEPDPGGPEDKHLWDMEDLRQSPPIEKTQFEGMFLRPASGHMVDGDLFNNDFRQYYVLRNTADQLFVLGDATQHFAAGEYFTINDWHPVSGSAADNAGGDFLYSPVYLGRNSFNELIGDSIPQLGSVYADAGQDVRDPVDTDSDMDFVERASRWPLDAAGEYRWDVDHAERVKDNAVPALGAYETVHERPNRNPYDIILKTPEGDVIRRHSHSDDGEWLLGYNENGERRTLYDEEGRVVNFQYNEDGSLMDTYEDERGESHPLFVDGEEVPLYYDQEQRDRAGAYVLSVPEHAPKYWTEVDWADTPLALVEALDADGNIAGIGLGDDLAVGNYGMHWADPDDYDGFYMMDTATQGLVLSDFVDLEYDYGYADMEHRFNEGGFLNGQKTNQWHGEIQLCAIDDKGYMFWESFFVEIVNDTDEHTPHDVTVDDEYTENDTDDPRTEIDETQVVFADENTPGDYVGLFSWSDQDFDNDNPWSDIANDWGWAMFGKKVDLVEELGSRGFRPGYLNDYLNYYIWDRSPDNPVHQFFVDILHPQVAYNGLTGHLFGELDYEEAAEAMHEFRFHVWDAGYRDRTDGSDSAHPEEWVGEGHEYDGYYYEDFLFMLNDLNDRPYNIGYTDFYTTDSTLDTYDPGNYYLAEPGDAAELPEEYRGHSPVAYVEENRVGDAGAGDEDPTVLGEFWMDANCDDDLLTSDDDGVNGHDRSHLRREERDAHEFFFNMGDGVYSKDFTDVNGNVLFTIDEQNRIRVADDAFLDYEQQDTYDVLIHVVDNFAEDDEDRPWGDEAGRTYDLPFQIRVIDRNDSPTLNPDRDRDMTRIHEDAGDDNGSQGMGNDFPNDPYPGDYMDDDASGGLDQFGRPVHDNNPGDTVAEILGLRDAGMRWEVDLMDGQQDWVVDQDNWASQYEGIAIYDVSVPTYGAGDDGTLNVDIGTGVWQYSTDGGDNWTNFGSDLDDGVQDQSWYRSNQYVSEDHALLLRATDRVRYVPDTYNGTHDVDGDLFEVLGDDGEVIEDAEEVLPSFSFYAWDRTATQYDTETGEWVPGYGDGLPAVPGENPDPSEAIAPDDADELWPAADGWAGTFASVAESLRGYEKADDPADLFGTSDLSGRRLTSPFSEVADTVFIEVSSVNDIPTRVALDDNRVEEVAQWPADIDDDPNVWPDGWRDLGALVGALSTDDHDIGDTYEFDISGGDYNPEWFTIERREIQPADGEEAGGQPVWALRLDDGRQLDYADFLAPWPTEGSFVLDVTVSDQSGTDFTDGLSIEVVEVNEAPVRVIWESGSGTIFENAGPNTSIGGGSIETTVDPDTLDDFDETFVYELIEDPTDGGFRLIGDQLFVYDSTKIDYEDATHHSDGRTTFDLVVRVTDQRGKSLEAYDQPFTVVVEDVNEAPTGVEFEGVRMVDGYAAVEEYNSTGVGPGGAESGDMVAYLSAVDPDIYAHEDEATKHFQEVSYQFVSPVSEFSLVQTVDGWVLRVGDGAEGLDREAGGEDGTRFHELVLKAEDGEGLSSPVLTRRIRILPVNEFAPDNITLVGHTVMEETTGARVGEVTFSDEDIEDEHSMGAEPTDTFVAETTGANSGLLSLRSSVMVDFETQTQRSARILVTDSGGLTTSKDVTIDVQDFDETYGQRFTPDLPVEGPSIPTVPVIPAIPAEESEATVQSPSFGEGLPGGVGENLMLDLEEEEFAVTPGQFAQIPSLDEATPFFLGDLERVLDQAMDELDIEGLDPMRNRLLETVGDSVEAVREADALLAEVAPLPPRTEALFSDYISSVGEERNDVVRDLMSIQDRLTQYERLGELAPEDFLRELEEQLARLRANRGELVENNDQLEAALKLLEEHARREGTVDIEGLRRALNDALEDAPAGEDEPVALSPRRDTVTATES